MMDVLSNIEKEHLSLKRKKKDKTDNEKRTMKSLQQRIKRNKNRALHSAPSLLHDRISEQVIILILFIIIIISFLQAKQRRVRLHTPIIIDLSDDKVPFNPKKLSLFLGGGDSRDGKD